jgi:hypothetical protein
MAGKKRRPRRDLSPCLLATLRRKARLKNLLLQLPRTSDVATN